MLVEIEAEGWWNKARHAFTLASFLMRLLVFGVYH